MERIPIVLLGEKDHGKSTLLGRLLYETRSVPEDRLKNIKEWAHLLDSFRYEREYKMTLDATRVLVKLEKRLYEFIDVPGHKELVKNMLSGASQAEYGVLVIEALEGIKPQTIRHIKLALFLGIEKLIVAINKLDKIRYSFQKFSALKKDTDWMLKKFGFKKILVLPIAASRGENLTKKSKKLSWFRGPTLGEAILKNFKPSPQDKDKIKKFYRRNKTGANCIFIKNPRNKKLTLESYQGEGPIQRLTPQNPKINEPSKIIFSLRKKLTLTDKFVIKKSGEIIALCIIQDANR